jgi:ribosomal protein S1
LKVVKINYKRQCSSFSQNFIEKDLEKTTFTTLTTFERGQALKVWLKTTKLRCFVDLGGVDGYHITDISWDVLVIQTKY